MAECKIKFSVYLKYHSFAIPNMYLFISFLPRNEDVQKELRGWGLEFDQNLISIQGRTVPPEPIMQGGRTVSIEFNGVFSML